jgi:hypothetical protein
MLCRRKQTASVVWWAEFLDIDPEVLVRFPALLDFLRTVSRTGSTQPREYIEERLGRKSKRPRFKIREYGSRNPSH